jgi:hypothetical protein
MRRQGKTTLCLVSEVRTFNPLQDARCESSSGCASWLNKNSSKESSLIAV